MGQLQDEANKLVTSIRKVDPFAAGGPAAKAVFGTLGKLLGAGKTSTKPADDSWHVMMVKRANRSFLPKKTAKPTVKVNGHRKVVKTKRSGK